MIEKKLIKKCLSGLESLSVCIQRNLQKQYFAREEMGVLYNVVLWYYNNYKSFLTKDTLKITLSSSAMADDMKARVEVAFSELDTVVADEPIEFLIDALIKAYKEREVRQILSNVVDDFQKVEIDTIIDKVKKRFYTLEKLSNTEIREGDVRNNVDKLYQNYLEAKGGKKVGIYTGYPTLDYVTGGHKKGEIWIVTGWMKAGKSTFMLNIAHHIWKNNKNVVYFSLEIYYDSFARKLMVLDACISDTQVKHGNLSPTDEEKFLSSLNKRKDGEGTFWIVDSPMMSTTQIQAKIQELKNLFPIDYVIIDYLKLVDPKDKGQREDQTLGNAVLELRKIARVEEVPIMTAHQLNVEGKKAMNEGGKPGAEHIAGSKDILRHADFGMAIWVKDYEEKFNSPVCTLGAITLASRDSADKEFTLEACYSQQRIIEPLKMAN